MRGYVERRERERDREGERGKPQGGDAFFHLGVVGANIWQMVFTWVLLFFVWP